MANPNVGASVLAQLKEHVRDGITEMWYEGVNDAFLAQLETKEYDEGFGRGHVVRIVDAESSAIASNVDDAQSIAEDGLAGSSPDAARFTVDPIEIEGFAQFTRGEYLAARGRGADEELELLTQRTQGCIKGMRKRWGIYAVGDGSGKLAQVTGGVSGAAFEVDRQFANRIKAGDRIIATQSDGTTLRDSGTPRRVTSVDPDTSATRATITTSVAIGSLAANDFIFFQGHRTAGVPAGMLSWVPTAAVGGGDSFFGQNRFGRPQLQGFRFNASGYDTASAGIAASSRMFDFDKQPDTLYINSKSWELLTADKDANKVVETTVGPMKIGFSKIVLNGASKRPIDVVCTMFMPPGIGLLGQFKNADKDELPYIACVEGLANIDDIDGNTIRASKTGGVATYNMRFYSRGNIVFPAPGNMMTLYNLPVA